MAAKLIYLCGGKCPTFSLRDIRYTVSAPMDHSFDEWRAELREIDAELIALLQRRMEMAIELLHALRSEELTLGELEHDLDRLGIFLYAEIDEPVNGMIDKHLLLEIFSKVIREQKRLAEAVSKSQTRTS